MDNKLNAEKIKTAFVIGGSSGIGLEIAKKLNGLGCKVYNGSRTPCPEDCVTNLSVDVCYENTIADAVRQIIAENGNIDYLIYSAGYSMAAPVEYAKEEDYRHLFDVNFFGAVAAVRQVLPSMRAAGGGRIILVSSMGGSLPIAFDSFYSASKAALDMFAKALRIETKPYNIQVSCVLPGGTATKFTFKRNVYPDGEVGEYCHSMNKAVLALANIEQGGMAPEAVADTVIKVLSTNEPPALIASGATNKAFLLSQKLLPSRLCQFINSNQYNQ